MDLAFSGAGFMGCYYFGVVDCWRKYIPQERVNRASGSSAGSLIAAYYLMDLPLEPCLKAIIEMTEDIRRRTMGVFDRTNQIVDVLPRTLDMLFPDDAHKIVSGRLFVCMTRLKDMKKVVVSEFESKADLIDALNCSSFIPIWSGNRVPTFRGEKHIDGGFTDNLPIFDEYTIRVCCFSGDTDISPYDKAKLELLSATPFGMPVYLNMGNFRRFKKALFPPTPSDIIGLLERGFHDAKQFILTNDLIQCESCYKDALLHNEHKNHVTNLCITPRLGSPQPGPEEALDGQPNDGSKSGNYRRVSEKLSWPLRYSPADHKVYKDDLEQAMDPPPMYSNVNKLAPEVNKAPKAAELKNQQVISFSKMLESKLMAEDANNNKNDNNNNNKSNSKPTPSITITSELVDSAPLKTPLNLFKGKLQARRASLAVESALKSGLLPAALIDTPNGPIKTSQLYARRNTLATQKPTDPSAELHNKLGTMRELNLNLNLTERITFAPSALPSCPPSPYLDRHCTECISMRQAARNDNLEQQLRQEAESFQTDKPVFRESSLTNRLATPFRWIRQLGMKRAYSLAGPNDELAPKYESQTSAAG